MVGASQYLTMTRPDMAHAVHVIFQFVHALRNTHLFVVKQIFKYLQGTLADGLYI